MNSRYATMLRAIAKGEPILDEPTCRIERFLKVFANKEDPSSLPEPIHREEKYWLAIIKGETINDEPTCKREEYLKALANNEALPHTSETFAKEAIIFKQLIEEAGGSDEPKPPVTNLNYVSGGMLYLREAYSATQTADAITLR